MAKNDWRSFTFFDLRPDADNGKLADALQDARITASTTGKSRIIVCDSAGNVHVFNSNWLAVTFRAHDGPVALCELAGASNHLITVGLEDGGLSPTLKCWDLSKPTPDGAFPCVRHTKIASAPVSLAVADNGQCMAVGYHLGHIQLFRGDVKSARPKEAEALKYGSATIVGMAFKLAHKTLQLFVCNKSSVAVYVLPDRAKETLVVLDRDCVSNRCSVMQLQHQSHGGGTLAERHFMVGQDDAVYCYNSDGRGPCYALEGAKSSVHWFRSHLLTVYQSEVSQNLTVIDIQNNVIGYEAPIADVAAIFTVFGTCYVVTADKRVLHLDERDIRSKLNLLFKQSLYDIGARIAKNNHFDDEGLAEIFKKYGDHLGQRGKHQEAVEQYIKTIGFLEPSYVIRMFLDPRHIDHLVDYLKALHDRGVATANHTTLLLNCFTRLNKSDQLQDFLHVTSAAAAAANNATTTTAASDDDTFDVDVAIRVCRTTAPDVALTLAQQHAKHAAYLAILVEDQHAYSGAITYMRQLPFDDCEHSARKFGAVLMEHCPDEMTQLLMKLCTFYAPVAAAAGVLTNGTSASDQIALMRLLSEAASMTDVVQHSNGASDTDEPPPRFAQRADAVGLLHLFGKRPDRMVAFLEHLVANLSTLPPTIYNTLIELYVAAWRDGDQANADTVADQIMEILRIHEHSCDFKQALVLCRMYGFWPGVLYIYEEQGLYQLVVRHHVKMGNYEALLTSCNRLGGKHKDVWFQALNGLKTDRKCPTNLLAQILQNIARGNQRSPMQVLNSLAVADGPTLSAARDYFQQAFSTASKQIRKDEESGRTTGEAVAAHRREIDALTREAVEFRGTACLLCGQPLTMPAVYFMCKCSFHQDCLRGGADYNTPCPVCSKKPETLQLANALRSQAESRDKHDQFHDLLGKSPDPFALVAEYFGRSLFNQLVIVDENELVDINKNLPDEAPSKSAAAAASTTTATVHKPPKSATAAAATEATIRVQEAQHMRQEDSIRRAPLPEARMRLQEASKPKEAAATTSKRATPAPSFRAPQKKSHEPVAMVARGPSAGGGRAAVAAAYDPAKDPFAEDVAGGGGSLAKEATTLNPFGDCDDDDDEQVEAVEAAVDRKPLDSNLNPFE